MPTAQLQKQDFGRPPAADYAKTVHNLLRLGLKDPDSIRYDGPIKKPVKAYMCGRRGAYPQVNGEGKLASQDCRFGWLVTARYNAKNGFGGYAGYTLLNAFFVDQKVVSFCPGLLCNGFAQDIAEPPLLGNGPAVVQQR